MVIALPKNETPQDSLNSSANFKKKPLEKRFAWMMFAEFRMKISHTKANFNLGGEPAMQNKSNLDTHNEVITVSEPWHRGSGFTWMLLALAGAVFFFSGAVAKSQTIYDWGDSAPDGNWTQGAGGARWWSGGLWNAPDAGNVLRFNNNHRTTMQNNVSGTYNIHGLIFGSSATTARTIGGNAIRLFDSGGTDPYIENSSSATHSINIAVSADGDSGDPLKINFNSTGGLTFGSTVNNQGSTVEIAGSNTGNKTLLFSGIVSGSGGMYINNSGVTVDFDAANTQTGQLTINAGTARLVGSSDTFGSSSQDIRIGSGAALNLNGVSAIVGSVSEEGFNDGGTIALGGGTLTVAGSNKGAMNQNSISGTGNLEFSGTGTSRLRLYGTQSYTGTTTINSGALATASALASSSVAVNGGLFEVESTGSAGTVSVTNGGTIEGKGSVGALTIASGGTLSPGNSPGTLTASSAIWEGGGTYDWEIGKFLSPTSGTDYDFLNITGALTIDASTESKFIIDVISLLSTDYEQYGLAGNWNADANYSFAIATAAGGIQNFNAGAFQITTSNFQNATTSSNLWSVAQEGNNLVLKYTGATAIPEPSSASMLVLGMAALLAKRRRG